jgi:regulatory protein
MTQPDQDSMDGDDEISQQLRSIRNTLARLLAGREHSQFELRSKLSQKGFDATLYEQVITQFIEKNLQSDRRYAESLIRSAHNKGKGPAFITQTLQQHEIELSDLNTIMYEQEWDWFSLAIKVREKRFGSEIPDDWNETQKQKRFLQYRGFLSSHIKEAFDS